jgi:hypothetical protein
VNGHSWMAFVVGMVYGFIIGGVTVLAVLGW